MKAALRMVRIVFFILLCFALAVNLWLIGSRLLLHQSLPKLFGFSRAVVLSGSMEPTFSAGDMLIFREKEQYEIGDIVVFSQGAALVTHRIVGEEENGFITRGDANNTEDSDLLPPENIHGVLAAIVPDMGGVLSFLRTPLGILILVLAGIALVEAPNLINRKRNVSDDE